MGSLGTTLPATFVPPQQDPVPPELTELLQQSQDLLLRVLFPPDTEEKTQEEEPSGQSRAPALTVVSKFKVGLVVQTGSAQFTHKSLRIGSAGWAAAVNKAESWSP